MLVFMAFLGFVNVYALRVNLSVAIVSMVKSSHKNTTSIDECPGQNDTESTPSKVRFERVSVCL